MTRFSLRAPGQVAGESTQLKGRIRSSFALDAFPCQPQRGFGQDSSSSPKIVIASFSVSETVVQFFCRLILWWSLGHSKTIRYAKLMVHLSTPPVTMPWIPSTKIVTGTRSIIAVRECVVIL